MNTQTAIKEILKETIMVAADLGRKERARLGRDLTEAEAQALAAMVQRQLRTALAMAR